MTTVMILMSRCWLQYPFKWRTREWNLMISDGFTFDILVMTSWGGDGKKAGQFTDRSSNISINDANLRGYGFILRNWYYVGAYLGKVKWLWLSDGLNSEIITIRNFRGFDLVGSGGLIMALGDQWTENGNAKIDHFCQSTRLCSWIKNILVGFESRCWLGRWLERRSDLVSTLGKPFSVFMGDKYQRKFTKSSSHSVVSNSRTPFCLFETVSKLGTLLPLTMLLNKYGRKVFSCSFEGGQ